MTSLGIEGKHIVLAAPPFSGHLHPILAIAKHLVTQGARCTVVTGPGKIERVQSLGLAAQAVLTHRPRVLESIADTDRPMTLNPMTMIRQVKANVSLLPEVMMEVRKFFDSDPPDLVINDFTAFPVAMVARSVGVPDITITPSPLAIENTDGVPSYFRGLRPGTSWISRVRDATGRKITRVVKRAFVLPFKKELNACGFELYRSDGTESIYSDAATLGLGMYELEFPRTWPRHFKMIGPICFAPETELIIDLRALSKKPLVLVTAGTHVWWAKKNFLADTRALREAHPNLYFVFSLGDSQKAKVDALEKNDRYAVFSYIPYDQHLPFFSAVLHHAGSGILYQCIKLGIPALARPLDYDQFDYAARMHHHNLGVSVSSYHSVSAIRGLQRIIDQPDTFAFERFAQHLTAYNPFDEVTAAVDRLL